MSATVAPAIEAVGLCKTYGARAALADATLSVAPGQVSALVGPNGAGKSTLLRLLAGLSRPSGGSLRVLGAVPSDASDFLERLGYLAQDLPLYRRLSVADHLAIGTALNRRFDAAGVAARLAQLDIAPNRRVPSLSGGERAQLALALALAKRPELLLLDEPVAALDPLARRQFLGALAAATAESGTSVVLSSHLLRDLEGVCDHLIVVADARVVLCESVEDVVATHRVVVGPRQRLEQLRRAGTVVEAVHTARQTRAVVRLTHPDGALLGGAWEVRAASLEEVVLAHFAASAAGQGGLRSAGAA